MADNTWIGEACEEAYHDIILKVWQEA